MKYMSSSLFLSLLQKVPVVKVTVGGRDPRTILVLNVVFVFFVFVFAYVCICIWQKGEKQKVVKATVVVFWNTDNIGVLLLLFLNAAFVVCI